MTDERIRIGPDHRVAPAPCPVCARTLDAATSVDRESPGAPAARPQPGDLTVCAYCATWLAFTADGLRVATDAEVQNVDPTLRRLPEAFGPFGRRRPS